MKSLLSYELKKILMRPFTIIVCIGCLAVVAFITLYSTSQAYAVAWGPDRYGSYDAIPQEELDRSRDYFDMTGSEAGGLVYHGKDAIQLAQEYTKRFEGTWDDERLRQIASEYQAFQDNPDIYTNELDAWAVQVRTWTLESEMSPAEVETYNAENPIYLMKPEYQYGEWQEWSTLSYLLDEYVINPDGSINSFEEAFPLVEQPALYEYHDGPMMTTQFQGVMIGIMAILMLIAGAAPIFSDEVATRAEPMLLAAKYGRDKLVQAKLLSGLIFGVASLLVLTVVNVLLVGSMQGFSGWGVPIQFDTTTYGIPFALTYLEYLFVILGYQVLGICSMAAFIMLLSALMRSAIPVVFASGLLAVLATLLASMGGGWSYYLCQTLPPGAVSPLKLLSNGTLDGWDALPIPQWALAIVVCAVFVVVSIVAVLRKYKGLSKA